tara:strand:- start:647 stop:1078 length:432 start_codon:yes stop_codon:yes gene_type:complete
MSKEEINPIIKAGIRIMTQVNEGLEIEVIGEMERTEPSEHYPIGQLGVSTIFRMLGMEERVFLGCQHCEDMINPMGHFLAEELVMMTFKEQMKLLMDGDAYKNYLRVYEQDNSIGGNVYYTDPLTYKPYSQKEFINKIKTDDE